MAREKKWAFAAIVSRLSKKTRKPITLARRPFSSLSLRERAGLVCHSGNHSKSRRYLRGAAGALPLAKGFAAARVRRKGLRLSLGRSPFSDDLVDEAEFFHDSV